jgi:hypothetical protein
MTMSLTEVIEHCEVEFPDWNWLVRSDSKHGAFANLSAPDADDWIDGKDCFRAYGQTAAAALSGAMYRARRVQQ